MKDNISKSSRRYRTWLVIWVAFIILFSTMLVINGGFMGTLDVYAILTHNFALDTAILFLIIPITCIVAFFVGGYLFTPLILFIHKKIIGRRLIYGLREMQRPKKFKGAFLNSLFPALLAFNIAILFSDDIFLQEFLFVGAFKDSSTGAGDAILQILTIVFLFPIASGIGIAVFSATYFLLDSGIEYTNKKRKKVQRGSFPPEIRSVGGYYLSYLKGYAGISVVISLAKLMISYFSAIGAGDTNAVIYIINLIVWPLIPFTITLFMIPVNIIQDLSYERRKKFTLKWAEKLGIRGHLEDPLGIHDKND